MSANYWAKDYKPAALARLRRCAASRRRDQPYLEALIAHWEAGGDASGAPAADRWPGLPFLDGVEIEAAVEDIYLRARDQAGNRAPEHRYVQRMERAATARARAAAARTARKAEGPEALRSLLDP